MRCAIAFWNFSPRSSISWRTAYAAMAHDAKRELLFTKARLQAAERELHDVPKAVRVICRVVGRMLIDKLQLAWHYFRASMNQINGAHQ